MMIPGNMAMPAPVSYPAPAYTRPQNSAPAVPAARAAAPARPVVRAKGPDDPTPLRRAPLVMPSPQQLGVTIRPAESDVNLTAIHTRIKELGIVSFHMETLTDGRCRFTCWLPREQPGRTQRIEAVAANEAEAVRLGLEQAGQARAGRP
jgi:hypothetical protein